MSYTALVKRRVVVTVAEPLEFVRASGKSKFTGSVREVEEKSCLVDIDEPLACGARTFHNVHCQVRHESDTTADLCSGGGVAFNATLFPRLEKPLGELKRSDFREGYATVAVVVLVD